MDFEFYETPETFTKYLFTEMHALGHSIAGRVFEPCVGSGAILRGAAAANVRKPFAVYQWITNDLDSRWESHTHFDATREREWSALFSHSLNAAPDWTVSNPPFSPAIEIIDRALTYSQVGVAMHLRASIHEILREDERVLRSGRLRPASVRRTWMANHTPTGILWLPRFGYQRSKTTGKWSTDSVCACWVIWLKDPAAPQFIRYAPEWVLRELDAETPHYRQRMDALMAERRRTA